MLKRRANERDIKDPKSQKNPSQPEPAESDREGKGNKAETH
jgi:hypothetical protein